MLVRAKPPHQHAKLDNVRYHLPPAERRWLSSTADHTAKVADMGAALMWQWWLTCSRSLEGRSPCRGCNHLQPHLLSRHLGLEYTHVWAPFKFAVDMEP